MRLGDLDALRKNMEFICMGIMAGTEPYNAPLTEIDNAPAVEPEKAKESEIIKAYTKGFDTGVETVKGERPQGEPVIKCQDCKYRVKEWREDKRMKEKGYWAYGCKHFGEIMGYWGFGGYDNEFCSDAERKGGAE